MPHSAATGALAVEGLRKAFGPATVLDGARLRAPAGRVVALLGPSGCGKTTLLRCIAGLERPDDGEVRLDDRPLCAPGVFVPPERRRIGMVFQDGALFPHLNVAGNVGYGLRREQRRRGRLAARQPGRVEQALDLVDLAGFGARMPASLSGGQQQRVALARALVTHPSVLLLDEPFSNLDTILRVQIRGEVQRLLADLGVTAVFVTHDQEEAFVVGDEVAVMLGGRIVQQAVPAELYRAPASRAVAAFLGDANLVPGVADAGLAHTAVGRVPLRAELLGDVDVLLRPEQLRVTAGRGADAHRDGTGAGGTASTSAGRASVGATIDAVEYYGHDAVYLTRLPGGDAVRVRVLDAPEFRPGDLVDLDYVGGPTVGYPRAAG
ncbi:MAG TPA: ABC transporter ATP-binding protein [Actinomycetes bacterium]|jgi:iron(III) transport system ATP-binding protein|nr:ABC transporter ATP-binding protein [Actinomycetes bacterium]